MWGENRSTLVSKIFFLNIRGDQENNEKKKERKKNKQRERQRNYQEEREKLMVRESTSIDKENYKYWKMVQIDCLENQIKSIQTKRQLSPTQTDFIDEIIVQNKCIEV